MGGTPDDFSEAALIRVGQESTVSIRSQLPEYSKSDAKVTIDARRMCGTPQARSLQPLVILLVNVRLASSRTLWIGIAGGAGGTLDDAAALFSNGEPLTETDHSLEPLTYSRTTAFLRKGLSR